VPGSGLSAAVLYTFYPPLQAHPLDFADTPDLNLASPQRRQHILYGDETGGFHLHPGGAGKSPFPDTWGPKKVMNAVSDIATDPNIPWKPNKYPGRVEATGIRDGISITVIIEPDGDGIITAWPNNVPKNPK